LIGVAEQVAAEDTDSDEADDGEGNRHERQDRCD
jgi:hypothetical protein